MKKSLLALAALTAFAGAASAQSSVTLFGLVDLSVYHVKNGSLTQKGMANDQLASNRIGFRGVEDLGGGLKAGFWIEGAMAPDAGTPGGQTWQRRSTVSLMGNFGEVRLGRDYTASFWNYAVFDPFGFNGPASIFNVFAQPIPSTLVRANNMVGYFLPAMGGLYGQFQVAAGEGNTGNKYYGGRLGYAAGPVNVSAAYGRNPADGFYADDVKDMNIGGSYAFGPAKISAVWGKREMGNVDQKTWLLGGTYAIGASTLKLSYAKSSGSADAMDVKQLGLGYQYNLSKRTALYASASLLDNGGDAVNGARKTIGLGPAQTVGGEKSRGIALGVSHTF